MKVRDVIKIRNAKAVNVIMVNAHQIVVEIEIIIARGGMGINAITRQLANGAIGNGV